MGTAGNTYARMSLGSLLICCKQHKTLAWLPRPINNVIPTPTAVNRRQSLASTIQPFNRHLFLLNNRQPGCICTSSNKASTVAAAAMAMPCPGSWPGMQPGATCPTPSPETITYGRLGVWPIGGRIPFIKCCKELFFVHHRSKYTVRVNEAGRSDGGSPASGGVRGRRTGTRWLARLTGAPLPCPEPQALFRESAGGGGELGVLQKPSGSTQTQGPHRTRGVLTSSVPAPPSETQRGEADSHGFANQGLAKM